jgi:hypothetical protein
MDFVTAALIIDKTWKQQRFSLIGEWVSELWFLQRMEYCSLLKDELASQENT